MGRAPCCEKDSVKRGPWTPEEDAKLLACIAQHGTGSWRTLPKKAGLQRCGKSCRLRWTNYLRPDLKHGRFSDSEEQLIVKLHAALGSRWSLIAAQLPGRTDNDVKNYWNTRLKKKLCEMGIDPITHKPISQLLADLAGSITLPKGSEIAEATLGCFKDDMLNVLMRKRADEQQYHIQHGVDATSACPFAPFSAAQHPPDWDHLNNPSVNSGASPEKIRGGSSSGNAQEMHAFAQNIKNGLSTVVQSGPFLLPHSFTVSVPSGPVNCVRSASSSLARRLPVAGSEHHINGQADKEENCIGFHSLLTQEFSFTDDQVSKSFLDTLLESSRQMTAFSSHRPEISPLLTGRSSSPTSLTQQSIGACSSIACLFPATSPARLGIPENFTDNLPQQQMFMSLLQQQEGGSGLNAASSIQVSRAVCNPGCQNSKETIAWSPSCSGASSSSSTNASAPQVSTINRALSYETLQLWDLSELGSMIS